ncbi:hypothetical protein BH18ACT17_BH18ACT17_06210 [soil metagenome]
MTILIAMTLAMSGCVSDEEGAAGASAQVRFSSTDDTLAVRVADSDGERAQGLMGVEDLGPDRGMAFLFDEPTTSSFWMKDTLIPLSIAFVDGERVVAIEEMVPCASDPCPTWDAGGAEYTVAIEANPRWFVEHGVGIGDQATLEEVGDG